MRSGFPVLTVWPHSFPVRLPGQAVVMRGEDRGGASRKSGDVDVRIGARVRLRRAVLGLTLEELGSRVGLSLQQIQKYEAGASRIPATRLYEISQVLDVPISWFFDTSNFASGKAIAEPGSHRGASREASVKQDLENLVSLFSTIQDPRLRLKIIELVELLAYQNSM
jgi:transcriptional regulator with XRE-family HTH domain